MASRFFLILKGTLYVDFVTSNPNNKLFTKVLNVRDVFVFPTSLIHFQFNVGNINAYAFSNLNSQNLRCITIANTMLGYNPLINPDIIIKAF
jgi:hypothetical protein